MGRQNTSMMRDIKQIPSELSACAAQVVGLIQRHRIDLSNEKAAQGNIEKIFAMAGLSFDREAVLSPEDRPDFFVEGVGLVIEVKLKGARKMDVFRQLKRYAAHDRVRGLVLVTSLSMGLPSEIEGKPVYYASMGRAWL